MRLIRKRLCSLLLCAVLAAGLLPMSGIHTAQAGGLSLDTPDLYYGNLSSDTPVLYSKGNSYDTPEARAAAVNKLRYRFLGEMLSHIGCAYEKGKGHFSSAKSFDCSGLIAHAFISIGYSRYFSISDKKWDPGKFQAYDGQGIPSSEWKDFSWRGSSGLWENVRDGQTIYLLPDSSKNPVLAFTVRKSDKKADFVSDISNPAKWPDSFREAVQQRGTIIVKNHTDQTKWHTTVAVGYYDADWFHANGHDTNPAKSSISGVKKTIAKDLVKEFSSYGLSSSVLTKVHRGLADGTFDGDKTGGKTYNSGFNDLDREDDVYPAMWDLRQRRITDDRAYSPLWQIDALNPRVGVSVNNSTLALSHDNSVAMVLEWEEYGSCSLTNYDNLSSFGGEDQPIAGAVYAIYDKDGFYEDLAKRKPLTTATADETGLVRFSGLPVSGTKHSADYYVIELSPPPDCQPNTNVYKVGVTRDGDTEIVEGGRVTSRFNTEMLSVQLNKADCLSDAVSWLPGSNADSIADSLPEDCPVGFCILRTKNVITADITDANSPLYNSSAVYTIAANGDIVRNGHILYENGTVIQTVFGSSNGTVTFTDLPPGKYIIDLQAAPNGFSSDFPRSGTRIFVTLTGEAPVETQTLSCHKLKLQPVIRVTDLSGLPVSGGRFALCCESDIYDYTGTRLLIAKDSPIAVGTADAEGLLRFGDTATASTFAQLLPVGSVYYITMLAPPDDCLPASVEPTKRTPSTADRVVEFTYTADEWANKEIAEYHFTIQLEKITGASEDPVPERVLPNEPVPTATPKPAEAGIPVNPVHGSVVNALPLFTVILLLGAATAILQLIRRKEDGR